MERRRPERAGEVELRLRFGSPAGATRHAARSTTLGGVPKTTSSGEQGAVAVCQHRTVRSNVPSSFRASAMSRFVVFLRGDTFSPLRRWDSSTPTGTSPTAKKNGSIFGAKSGGVKFVLLGSFGALFAQALAERAQGGRGKSRGDSRAGIGSQAAVRTRTQDIRRLGPAAVPALAPDQ